MKPTSLLTSVAIIASLGLVGCGGGSSSTTEQGTSVSGTAIDPELQDATVCLDMNRDRNCTEGEPTATTDQNGNFTLNLSESQLDGNYPLLVISGTDKESGEAFTGKLLADVNSTMQNITPLTTLAYDKTEAEMAKVETILGLDAATIEANIITLANEGNTSSLKAALSLQKSAEAINPEDQLLFYTTLSEKIKTSDQTDTLQTLILSITPITIQAKLSELLTDIEDSNTSEPYALSEETRMKAIALGIDYESMMEQFMEDDEMPSH
jgi:hypothetical protein